MIDELGVPLPHAGMDNHHIGRQAAFDQAGVVHDLGNLLQVVSSALSIISRDVNVTNATKLNPVFAAARSSLECAGRLIRQNVGSARESLASVEHVDLAQCLGGLTATIHAVRANDISIEIIAAPGLGRLLCNKVELENAVLNLAVNAIDAMPGGGVLLIEVRECAAGSGEEILLRVTDTGCGMSPETAARAADPYFTTKGSRGGSGVGLAMVTRFAKSVGGRVAIDSVLGDGTAISLYIPAASRIMEEPRPYAAL